MQGDQVCDGRRLVRQWWRSVGVVAVALTVVAYGLAFAQQAEDNQKKLQGTWTSTKAERDGKAADDVVGHRLSLTGNRFQISPGTASPSTREPSGWTRVQKQRPLTSSIRKGL